MSTTKKASNSKVSVTTKRVGRKTDVVGVIALVKTEWRTLQSKIEKELSYSKLPTRKNEVRKFVLEVASKVIAGSTRIRRSAKKSRGN
jgi:hypothetical protein